MINKNQFPKLNKIQDKNLWFIHVYKDGGLCIFKSINIKTDPVKENEFKFMGDDMTPDDKFFTIQIRDNKPWFHPSNKDKNKFGYTVCVRNEKGHVIPDIMTKEILEAAITNNTIVLESNEVQALIDADCTIEKFFETNKKNTFWFA